MSRVQFATELVAILVQQGSIAANLAPDLVRQFQDDSKAEFDEFLRSAGLVTKAQLLAALSAYYRVPAFDVEGYLFDHELLINFPKDVLLNQAFIPLQIEDNLLAVVASVPSDDLIEKIGEYVPYVIELRVGLQRAIIDSIEEFYDASLTNIADLNDDDEADLYQDDLGVEEVELLDEEDDVRL